MSTRIKRNARANWKSSDEILFIIRLAKMRIRDERVKARKLAGFYLASVTLKRSVPHLCLLCFILVHFSPICLTSIFRRARRLKQSRKKLVKPTGTLFRARLLPFAVVRFHCNIPQLSLSCVEGVKEKETKKEGEKEIREREGEKMCMK